MNVTHTLTMDLSGPAVVPKVDMVQGDQYVRVLKLALLCGGEPWTVPEDTHAIICYQKEDGTGGEYDTLPDGTIAYTAEDNILTVEIAPQVLTHAGLVRMAVDLLLGDARLSTFVILLQVQKAIPLGLESGDYFKLEGFLSIPKSGEVGQLLRISGVSDAGQVTGVEGYDLLDALEEAKDSGLFNGKSAYEIALDNGFEGTEEEWLESLKGEGITPALGNIAQINITGQLTTDYNVTVDFNGSRLQRVKDPVEDTDGVNKGYVDGKLAEIGSADIPDCWEAALATAEDTVTQLQDKHGRGAVSFLWFSDSLLGPEEDSVLGNLAAEMMELCHVPYALFSGNAIDDSSTTESTWRQAVKHADQIFKPVSSKLLRCQGINDGSRGSENYISLDTNAVYGALFRKYEKENFVCGPDGTYYYVDYAPSKLRLVVLNCCQYQTGLTQFGFGNDQINWFASTALELPGEDWALGIVCHIPPDDTRILDADALLAVLAAFEDGISYSVTSGTEGETDYVSVQGDFSGKYGGDVLGFFCGSTGEDDLRSTGSGVRILTIRPSISREEGAAETTQEYAMDVVTLEPGARTVYLTRLGSGDSRSFDY